jgi:hypothetical protein
MKKIWKLLILIVAIVVFLFLFFRFADFVLSPASLFKPRDKACFASHCFLIELAKTDTEKERGLMFKSQLDKDRGMLFIFNKEGVYPFWMKNTLIPLDIIWINKEKSIVFINKNSQPCNNIDCPLINPQVEASYVLEINAGISDEIGLKPGDSFVIK